MITIQQPAIRKTYAGVGDPIFSDDIRTANEMTMKLMCSLIGDAMPFAILEGCHFDGSLSLYSQGIIYFHGNAYYCNSIGLNYYPNPTTQDVENKQCHDGNNRNIYTEYIATASITQPDTDLPKFTGDMDNYRISSTFLKSKIDYLAFSIKTNAISSNTNNLQINSGAFGGAYDTYINSASGSVYIGNSAYHSTIINPKLTGIVQIVDDAITEIYNEISSATEYTVDDVFWDRKIYILSSQPISISINGNFLFNTLGDQWNTIILPAGKVCTVTKDPGALLKIKSQRFGV